MSYTRVIPRDLFNEADLLKMLGKLWLLTERCDGVSIEQTGPYRFEIEQDETDGSIFMGNLEVVIKGKPYRLYRPLNSREPWPLWIGDLHDPDFEDFRVFMDLGADEDPSGALSDEMLALIGDYLDDAFVPCSSCAEEHPEGVLDDGLCPSCVDKPPPTHVHVEGQDDGY